MHRLVVTLGISAIVIGASASHAAANDAGAPWSIPACVQVSTDARYVPYGYNHVVVIKNGCTRAATCIVATDVNPERQNVAIPAGNTIEVTTFVGSPSSRFAARVSCTLR